MRLLNPFVFRQTALQSRSDRPLRLWRSFSQDDKERNILEDVRATGPCFALRVEQVREMLQEAAPNGIIHMQQQQQHLNLRKKNKKKMFCNQQHCMFPQNDFTMHLCMILPFCSMSSARCSWCSTPSQLRECSISLNPSPPHCLFTWSCSLWEKHPAAAVCTLCQGILMAFGLFSQWQIGGDNMCNNPDTRTRLNCTTPELILKSANKGVALSET